MTPGERIKMLRKALGWSLDKVAERSGGKLDRQRMMKIERGESKLTSVNQRAGLAAAFGAAPTHIDALIEGRITVETLLSLLRLGPQELGSAASPGAAATAPTPEGLGEAMGTAIQLRDLPLMRFPNLEICVEYHRRGGKQWLPGVLAAARAGHYTEHDLSSSYAWERALDELQVAMSRATVRSHAKTLEPKGPKS
jgi:transcriptional regulator with XRE-family HTH domain